MKNERCEKKWEEIDWEYEAQFGNYYGGDDKYITRSVAFSKSDFEYVKRELLRDLKGDDLEFVKSKNF